MPYLIDGHNLIGAMKSIRLSDPDDEMKLVNKLRSYAARKGKKITVVFDGGLPGGKSIVSNDKVTVIFASYEHTTADNILSARIKRLHNPRGWTLVTNDQALLHLAKKQGMQLMRSTAFAATLERLPEPPDLGEWPHPIISRSETDYWAERMTNSPAPAPSAEPPRVEPPPATPAPATSAPVLPQPTQAPPKPKPVPRPARPKPRPHDDDKPLMNNKVDEWLKLFGAEDDTP